MAVKPTPAATSRRDRWRIRRRAWILDAAWNPTSMQGLGVVHALLPVLRHQTDLAAGLRRHAVAFNCNLWLAPTLLGAMARLEAESRGDAAVQLRDRLAAPLSGAGDLYVWRAVRPSCLALALVGVLAGHPIAAGVIAVLLHDAALLWRQRHGFEFGWRHGASLESDFQAALPSRRFGRGLQRALVLVAGGLAGWGLVSGWQVAPSHAFLMSGALVVGYYAAQRQFPPGITFVGLVCVAAWLRRFSNPVGLP